jgi:hypothetical protein
MRAEVCYITQYHPTAMVKMIRDLWLKYYWNSMDFDGKR